MVIRKIALFFLLLLLLIPTASAQQLASIDVPAVTDEGEGIMTSLEVEINPGKGRILINSAPLIGIETQDSERIAVDIAGAYTDFNFSAYDIIFTVGSDAGTVEGPSAGAAMAVATIAAIDGVPIRDDAAITGTIDVDGSIGVVGHILEKAEIAAELNKSLFLIPAGQTYYPLSIPVTEEIYPGWEIIRPTTANINIIDYAQEEWGLTVIEVPNIYEAVRILIHGYNSTLSLSNVSHSMPYLPETPTAPPHIEPMEQLADRQINLAVQTLAQAQAELTLSILDEDMKQPLQASLNGASASLERARDARSQGILYGAANFAFQSFTNSRTVLDMVRYESLDSSREKVTYLGDRIVESKELLDSTEAQLVDVQVYVNDQGSYEWAIAAEERLVQSQEIFDYHSNSSYTIFNNLALLEGWCKIADEMYGIAVEKSNGVYIDTSVYKNQSEAALLRAGAELDHYSIHSQFGPGWYAEAAAREYQNQWYLASYLDASIAVTRVETGIELNTRSWENLVLYITSEVQAVETYDSVWGTLYKNYAEYTLAYAVANQDVFYLQESLKYARQAELFAETAEDIRYLPAEPKPLIENIPEEDIFWLAVLSIMIIFTGIFFGYLIFYSKKLKKKRK